jgi:hypothetical protein
LARSIPTASSAKLRQVGRHRRGDFQAALLGQHHRRDRGDRLGHRRDAEDRVHRHRRLGLAVAPAERLGIADPPRARDRDHRARDQLPLDILPDDAGQAIEACR